MQEETRCPETEVLERYAAGLLTRSEAREFEAHLEVCGLCEVAVERLADFDRVAAEAADGGEPDWEAMSGRLGLKRGESGAGAWAGWLFRVPAIGYALALALAYPAWLGVTKRAEEPAAPTLLAGTWAGNVDLVATRGDAEMPAVTAARGEKAHVLQFYAPAGAGVRQRAEIRDAGGHVVLDLGEVKSYDGRGNFTVVVDPVQMKAGQYELIVLGGLEGAGQKTVFEFERR